MWKIDIDERRQDRSAIRAEALHLQLLHAASVFDYEAFVLADERGLLVASSTHSAEGDAIANLIAAFSAMLVDSRTGAERGVMARHWLADEFDVAGIAWDVEELHAHEFFVGDERLFLVAVGGESDPNRVGVFRVIFGVRRIWTRTHQQELASHAG